MWLASWAVVVMLAGLFIAKNRRAYQRLWLGVLATLVVLALVLGRFLGLSRVTTARRPYIWDSPVPVAICRWLLPDCQRRTTSAISTLDTSLYAIAAPYIQAAAMVANPAHRVVKPPGEVVYRSWRSPPSTGTYLLAFDSMKQKNTEPASDLSVAGFIDGLLRRCAPRAD